MPKFEAMMGMLALVVPFVERDEKGQIVRDQTVTFNSGNKVGKNKIVPAYLSTEDPVLVKFLKSYGGNEANGGTSFRELAEKKSEVKAEKPAPAPAAAVIAELPKQAVEEPEPVAEAVEDKPFVFPDDLAVAPAEPATASSANDYPEANTVQEASAVLRRLFPDLTTLETNNKKKVFDVAASKNVTFSNLKP